MGRPIFFAMLIIIMAFIPVFTLVGEEGKLFHPLAYTKTFAMIGATLLAVTMVPALCTFLVRGPFRPEDQNWMMQCLLRLYEPALDWALTHRRVVLEVCTVAITIFKVQAVRGLLDEAVRETDLHWSWEMIRDNLHACNVYVTWDSIVIRPAIPPTFTHLPFINATQRVYMSATLGEGGELERSIGILEIKHMAIPPGWDRQSSGRRLILLPNLSLDEDQRSLNSDSGFAGFSPTALLVLNGEDFDGIKDSFRFCMKCLFKLAP